MRGADPSFVRAVIKEFGKFGIEAGYIVPTVIALEKSIMDATEPLRHFLREKGIHDYSCQGQGPENKKVIPAEFIYADRTAATTVSLYRPVTKNGDPRIWFAGLPGYAKPYDLLALICADKKLFIANVSNEEIFESLKQAEFFLPADASINMRLEGIADSPQLLLPIEEEGPASKIKFQSPGSIKKPASPLARIALSFRENVNPSALHLLNRLRDINSLGYVPSVRSGDTGVGATLESLLGIKANSKKTPDFEGIEIKASRHRIASTRSSNRVNLFSQVPNWKISPVGRAIEVLRRYGYPNENNRLQLYCTVDGLKPNTQCLKLDVDSKDQLLKVMYANGPTMDGVMNWEISKLQYRLAEKHPESFWVKAETTMINGREHFLYHEVVHTSKPLVSNLESLLSTGIVTLDLTMSEKGANGVRDHGYLFKIWPEDFVAIFPPPNIYKLKNN